MGKKTFVAGLLLICGMSASAQFSTNYEDTFGMFPYLYYNDWPQTGIYHENSVYCETLARWGAHGTTSVWTNDTRPQEYAVRMHTDDTLHIIGLACSWQHPASQGYSAYITLYDSAMNPLARNTVEHHLVMPTTADTNYHLLKMPGCANPTPMPNTRLFCEYFWFSLFDGKESEPVDVVGDFYIGICRQTYYRYEAMSVLFWYEEHMPPYYFPGSDYRLKYNGEWDTLMHEDFSIPHLFPIIDPKCVSLDSVVAVADSEGCLTVRWDSLPTQSQWVVSFGREGTLPGEGRLDTVDVRSWSRCGLEPGGHYSLSIQSRCEMLYHPEWSPWSEAWALTASEHSDPGNPDPEDPNEGIGAVVSAGFTLHPNPATGEVTVSAPAGGRLTVCDMRGVEVMRRELAEGPLTLDVGRLPKGTYMVSLTTDHGTTTHKLAVQ